MTTATESLLHDWMVLPIEARRQLVRARGLDLAWVELPVSLEKFLYDPAYLNHTDFFLSDIQLETVEALSEIFDIEAAKEDPTRVVFAPHQYIEAVCQWGKGGGKDTVVRFAFCRLLYLFGCLTSPHAAFTGIASYDSITLLNVALSGEQADDAFFNPLKRLMSGSPWFMQKLQPIIRDRSIDCPPIIGSDDKSGDMYAISAVSGHSAREALEGKNLFICAMDEIDAFRSDKAGAFYDSVTSTVQSRFPGIGKVVLLSWPRPGSFIIKKREEGESDPDVYTSGPYAVFEANLARTEAEFEKEKKRDLERYETMYLARPGKLSSSYFQGPEILRVFHASKVAGGIVRSVADPGIDPPVDWRTMQLLLENLDKPQRDCGYCWHVDLAVTQCNAAAAMSHHAGWYEDEYGDTLPSVVLDMVYWWPPPPGGQIDFAAIRRFILEFARMGYLCTRVTFDGFQSDDSIQILSKFDQRGRQVQVGRDGKPLEKPIETGKLSLDRNTMVYDTFKAIVNEPGRFRGFFCPLAIEEFLGLVKVKADKIDHQDNGSKDVSDAIAGAVYNATMHTNVGVETFSYWGSSIGEVIVGADDGRQVGHVPYPGKVPRETIPVRFFG